MSAFDKYIGVGDMASIVSQTNDLKTALLNHEIIQQYRIGNPALISVVDEELVINLGQ